MNQDTFKKTPDPQNYCTDGIHYEGKKTWSAYVLADTIYSI